MEKLIKPKAKKPQKEIGVKEVVDEEKRELQLSTISQHLSEKSEVKPRISKSDEPMVRAKTTIKMTPSSQKSMVAQSLEKETENKSEVQNTPSNQKSMVICKEYFQVTFQKVILDEQKFLK